MFRRRNPSSEENLFSLDQRALKAKINKNLSHIVKELQKDYPLSSAPVLSESVLAQHFCSVLESAFIHGLKASYIEKDSKQSRSTSKNTFPKPQFWSLILKISHAETINRVQALPFITSKIGKCRAWLRLTLNDSAVTSYLATVLSQDQRSTLTHFYDSHALFLDNEQADIFLRYLQGVESVIFELSFNSSILNQWTKTPLELAGLVPPSSSVPFYIQIQSKVENNNLTKPRLSARHRGSAPAMLLREQFSQSLPVTSGNEWLKKNKERHTEEKDDSPRLEKTINEEDEGSDGTTPVATPTEDSILHRRKLIKKRRKKSYNDLSKTVLGSWSSLSSGESLASSCNGGGTGSARNTPRSRSFCETPPTTVLLKNPSQMAEKDLRRPRLKSQNTPEQRYLASEIPLEDGIFSAEITSNKKSTPLRDRKNTNLVLTPKREKSGSDSSDKTDGIEHFKSFPPEGPMEQGPRNPSSGLEDSSSSQSSDNVETKLGSQMPIADNYKMSFVTSSSSGPEDGGVQGDTQGQNIDGQGQLSADIDVMNKSTDAIDIYSSSVRYQEDPSPPADLTFDFSAQGRMGNSLTRDGGWSVPDTPDFEQTAPKSAKSRGLGSSSQNVISSLEETPVEIKLLFRDEISEESPVDKGSKGPEIFIRREGYLKKMGEQFKQWKQRWFVLRGLTLSYYKDKDAEKPMGTIDLTDVRTVSEEKDDTGADVIIIMNDDTKHHLAAENKEVTLDWAVDFRTVITGSEVDNKHDGEDIYSTTNYLDEYEIITVPGPRRNGSGTSWYASMMVHMGKIANEKGLDSQNYQCADCASPIGIIYGTPRVCNFTGQYYCSQCHANEEAQIPARIIHNWDFRKHKVSKRAKNFIGHVFSDPLINLKEINPGIYKYIDEMGKFLQLRQQIVQLKPYLEMCRNFRMEDVKSKLTGARLHFLDDCHLYSIKDFCDVHEKNIANTLSKIVNKGTKHVYGCDLCSAKGFLCEICQKDEIIFPFQTNSTIQCSECKSVFHRECKNDSCPKCDRRQQRLMIAAAEMKEVQDDFENSD